MSVQKTLQLSSGLPIPVVGLGVYKASAGGECYTAVLSALKLGYRHLDTAKVYNNEEDVGQAVRDSGVTRSELFVTTKLWLDDWGYDKASAAIRGALHRLGLDYVDLMLMHAPGDPGTRADTWQAMEEAQQQGLIRSIGVSNFGIPHLEKLLKTAVVAPAVNQIELSPFLQRRELVEYCTAKGIVLEAYSPLCKASKLDDPRLKALAAANNITVAQLLLRWSLQHGFVPLPKSVNPERQQTNLDIFSFQLSDADMAALDALDEHLVTGWDPIATAPV